MYRYVWYNIITVPSLESEWYQIYALDSIPSCLLVRYITVPNLASELELVPTSDSIPSQLVRYRSRTKSGKRVGTIKYMYQVYVLDFFVFETSYMCFKIIYILENLMWILENLTWILENLMWIFWITLVRGWVQTKKTIPKRL